VSLAVKWPSRNAALMAAVETKYADCGGSKAAVVGITLNRCGATEHAWNHACVETYVVK